MSKIIAWVKANPWKAAVIGLVVVLVIATPVSYCGGYVKGCGSAQEKAE